MKSHRTQLTLLLITVILLVGCTVNEKETPKQVDTPTETQQEDESVPVVRFIQGEEKPDPPEQSKPISEPNTIERLHQHISSLPNVEGATHDQLRVYVIAWEHMKHLLNENNIPYTSDYRKTPHLTQAYITLGEYDKAIQNKKEQEQWIQALKTAGLDQPNMSDGLLQDVSIKDIEVMKQSTYQNKKGEER